MPIIKARIGRIDTVRYVSRLQWPNRAALLSHRWRFLPGWQSWCPDRA